MIRITLCHGKDLTSADEREITAMVEKLNIVTSMQFKREEKVAILEYGKSEGTVSEACFFLAMMATKMDEYHIKKLELAYEEG